MTSAQIEIQIIASLVAIACAIPGVFLVLRKMSLISDAINDLVNKINPKIVFLPHIGDSHIDHQIIHKASLVALRPINKNNLIKILSYETLSETEWGVNSSNNLFIPNYFIALKSVDS